MTRETLEQYSLVSLYSALAVLTLAMLGYVIYLARAASATRPVPPRRANRSGWARARRRE